MATMNAMSTPLLASITDQIPLQDSRVPIVNENFIHHPSSALPSSSSLHFLSRLYRLLSELKPYHALLLALLSIVESIFVAHVGKVAGSFYQIVVDKQASALFAALVRAATLYMGCIATAAIGVYISGLLSVKWRSHLTRTLHSLYCSRYQKQQDLHKNHVFDNPDQRMTIETANLCDALSNIVRLGAGAPFRVLYYSTLSHYYLGWFGIIAALAFFVCFAFFQRFFIAPFAQCVVRQEQKEGNFRFSHLRMRERRLDIAAVRGGFVEQCALNAALDQVLINQTRLVTWRSLVTAVTKITDYSGALLNYIVVAAAVFGFWGSPGFASSGGETAEFVSNASFASLSLIYSLTELLDLSEQLSTLAALTARVVGLWEALLEGSHHQETLMDPSTYINDENNLHYQLQPSEFASLLQPPLCTAYLGGTIPAMEVSIHRLGRDLENEIKDIFPDYNCCSDVDQCQTNNNMIQNNNNSLVCILTFQFSSIDLSPDRSSATLASAACEMDVLLDRFLAFESALRQGLEPYWCDAVNPKTGMPLHGGHSAQGHRWSEVAAARALLGYQRRDAGICPMVVHPVHGTCSYPVSVFTNAPYGMVLQVLNELQQYNKTQNTINNNGGDEGGGSSMKTTQRTYSSTPTTSTMLLAVYNLTVTTPSNTRVLIRNLSFTIHRGEWTLITGRNGAGKSTMLRMLCGVLSSPPGSIIYFFPQINPFDDPSQAMILPQVPLIAPGSTMRHQIAYPLDDVATNSNNDDTIFDSLLHQVGLSSLVGYDGDFSALSPGELQRLSLARVLYHRPQLALLDEPCSAMDEESAHRLLLLLKQAGVTCLTVAQGTAMYRELHHHVLEL